MSTETEKITWIFIPLPLSSMEPLRIWLHRAVSKKDDAELVRQCDEIIKKAFLKYNLSYDCDRFGAISMSELRLIQYSDGIAVPEYCFIEPDPSLKRVLETLHPVIRDV